MIALLLVACGGSRDTAAKDLPTPPELQPLEDKLLALAGCEPTYSYNDAYIAMGCEGRKEFREAVRAVRDDEDAPIVGLAAKHLHHEDPAVRIGSGWLLSQPFSVREGGVAPLLAAAKRERDARALSSFVYTLGEVARRHDDVSAWLRDDVIGHDDAEVRRTLAVALGGPGALRMEGALEALLALAENDPDPDVRARACQYLGQHDDPRAVPLMEKLTASAKEAPEVYRGCLVGLLSLWTAGTKRFEPAYRVSLQRLGASDAWHRWPLVWSQLVHLDPDGFREHDWFDPAPLIEIFADLVRNRAAAASIRRDAVGALVKHGAPGELLVELHQAYETADDDANRRVRDALAEAADL
jgi:HEAT repeat protein